MNPIDFMTLSEVDGLLELTEEQIAATEPENCPHRQNPVTSKTGLISLRCKFLSDDSGGDIGVGERVCRVCLCHGAADPDANAYLARQLVCLAWHHTVAPTGALEPARPDDAALALAVEHVKRFRDSGIARRFVDSLVYHQSVTPQEGADLLDTLGLSPGAEG